jgi:hypothetical protein
MDINKFKEKVLDYGKSNGYEPTSFELQVCSSGHDLFNMYSDDNEGGCGITCAKCDEDISVDGSADYMEDVGQNVCNCGSVELHVLLAKAYYSDSKDARWVYIGGMCPKCNLSGVYVDWAER